MTKVSCLTCQKPKATLTCELCKADICKYCAQLLDDSEFSFMPQIPPVLTHSVYCAPCFDQNVAEELAEYQATMEKAKDVLVYFKNQSKETRLLKRIEPTIEIKNCRDQDETVLRLAFLAAKSGFNGVIDIEVFSQKVKNGSFQYLIWRGVGIPTQVKTDKLLKDRSTWQNPS